MAREPLGDQVGVALGERVDDARALEPRQPGGEPGEPLGLPGQLDDLEAQAGAPERPAVGAQRRGGVAGAQLRLDVGDHAVVGGRGRAEHGDAVGQPLEHLGEAPVVGPEVVPPVGDAVRLVDHEQPDALGEQRQHRVAELRVVEPLGADQQQVDRVRGEQLADLLPRVAVGRVDRVRADPEPLGRGDLVAHQRQQRRDDQRRAGALLAQQRGGEEVDGRLAPARALHAQHAPAVVDEVAHRLELVRAEARVRPGERAQQLGGALLDRHRRTVGRAPEISPRRASRLTSQLRQRAHPAELRVARGRARPARRAAGGAWRTSAPRASCRTRRPSGCRRRASGRRRTRSRRGSTAPTRRRRRAGSTRPASGCVGSDTSTKRVPWSYQEYARIPSLASK